MSRVSFRDVPYGGADFDEKMIEGLGITPRDTIKGAAGDPKVLEFIQNQIFKKKLKRKNYERMHEEDRYISLFIKVV